MKRRISSTNSQSASTNPLGDETAYGIPADLEVPGAGVPSISFGEPYAETPGMTYGSLAPTYGFGGESAGYGTPVTGRMVESPMAPPTRLPLPLPAMVPIPIPGFEEVPPLSLPGYNPELFHRGIGLADMPATAEAVALIPDFVPPPPPEPVPIPTLEGSSRRQPDRTLVASRSRPATRRTSIPTPASGKASGKTRARSRESRFLERLQSDPNLRAETGEELSRQLRQLHAKTSKNIRKLSNLIKDAFRCMSSLNKPASIALVDLINNFFCI